MGDFRLFFDQGFEDIFELGTAANTRGRENPPRRVETRTIGLAADLDLFAHVESIVGRKQIPKSEL